MTQKFNSVNESDKEFIPSLETLLSNNIPSFEFIRNYEENAPEDITLLIIFSLVIKPMLQLVLPNLS